MCDSNPSLARLRADLHRAAEIDDVAQRTLEVVAVIEEAAAPLGIRPTVVGGMAVYFWTEGDAFVTYDIDVSWPFRSSSPRFSPSSASHEAETAGIGSFRARRCCWKRRAPTWTPAHRSP